MWRKRLTSFGRSNQNLICVSEGHEAAGYIAGYVLGMKHAT